MKNLNFIVGWSRWKRLVNVVLFIFVPVLYAEEEQTSEIDAGLLEFLGSWESKDEGWQVILDERLWQGNGFEEGERDE